MPEPTISLCDGETLADYAIRVTRERDEAKHLAAVFGCRDDYRHTEDECPLCRAEAELYDLRALLRAIADRGVPAVGTTHPARVAQCWPRWPTPSSRGRCRDE